MNNYESLIGNKYGRRVVVGLSLNKKRGASQAYCRCECGRIDEVRVSDLKVGRGHNCSSCAHGVDLTGRRFYKLLVLKKEDNGGKPKARWICKCDCGTEKLLYGKVLLGGKQKSCGCGRIKSGTAFRSVLNDYKQSARARKIPFLLTDEEFRNIVQGDCHYCKSGPTRIERCKSGEEFACNGVDRMDSKIGYVVSNCVPACRSCNVMKWDMSTIDFIAKCKLIAARFS